LSAWFRRQKKLGAAAESSDLVPRAGTDTTQMLQGLLRKLGFTDVQVHFAKPMPAS
jgi:hypothetical protein